MMQKLLESKIMQAALEYLKEDDARTLKEHLELVAIPAPSNHEELRAKDMLRRFKELGLEDVHMDEVWNVLGTVKGTLGSPVVMLAGHLDTVFPATVDVTPKIKDGIIYAPGIADDTRALADLLTIIRAIKETGIKPIGDLVFCANVGEEGLGDLRGVKNIFGKENNIDAFVSIDDPLAGSIVNKATGSNRYRFTFIAKGGHSFADFGRPSAIHALGIAIAKIAQFKVPQVPKTTYNVGVIDGGTSVNTIAAKASLLLDIRSDSQEELKRLSVLALKVAQEAVEEENTLRQSEDKVQVQVEQIGDRPSGVQPDDCLIVRIALEATNAVGIEAKIKPSSSTDANVPISLGIPAITVGCGGRSGGIHTEQEWCDPKDAYKGPQKDLLMIMAMVGVEGVQAPMIQKFKR
ncbi:MAG: M20/M25/M40 family metallo-hydrolase [Acholeplasmataceae bacterium]|nr:M20/M25/M40 family metallo-hydrolase [Acholeplasmataceae bacterium]